MKNQIDVLEKRLDVLELMQAVNTRGFLICLLVILGLLGSFELEISSFEETAIWLIIPILMTFLSVKADDYLEEKIISTLDELIQALDDSLEERLHSEKLTGTSLDVGLCRAEDELTSLFRKEFPLQSA